MKLAELVAKVAPTVGMKPGEMMKAVDALFSAIKDSVAQGEKVSISGMGSFILKSRPAGEKTDPKTGQVRPVEAASTLGFKASTRAAGGKKQKTSGEESNTAGDKA